MFRAMPVAPCATEGGTGATLLLTVLFVGGLTVLLAGGTVTLVGATRPETLLVTARPGLGTPLETTLETLRDVSGIPLSNWQRNPVIS